MTMPRVLMLGPSIDARGGMSTVERNIIEAVKKSGDSVEFIPTYEDAGKFRKLSVAGAAYARFLARLGGCDLVHIHMASRGSFDRKRLFMRAAFRRGVPVVVHMHGGEFGVWYEKECGEAKRAQIREAFGGCAKVIVLSEEWRSFFDDNRICDPEKIVVLHNAVEIPARSVDVCLRQDVLFLGRLGAGKSPDVLLRAAKTVLNRHPQTRFRFGGDGDVTKYEALAHELGVADSCDFLGWTTGTQKEEAIRASRVFCLPSRNEGMPMSVLEAMSYGLATIATPVGGVPQVIQDGANGYLMPIGDSEFLARRINDLLDNSDLSVQIGRAGRKTIEESFGMDSYAQKLTIIYEGIAGGGNGFD